MALLPNKSSRNKNGLEHSNKLLFTALKAMLPKSFNLTEQMVAHDGKLISILLQLHDNLNRLLVNDPSKKAFYLLIIARSLNNRVASSFVPEDYDSIKSSTNLQKISIAYCRMALQVYNQNSLTLESSQVDDLNYLYNVIDINLNIISSCGVGNIHKSEDLIYINKFAEINKRLNALIKRNPKPEYFNLQSLLFTYMGMEEESKKIIARGLRSNQRIDLSNITENYYRERLKKGKFPVVIYV